MPAIVGLVQIVHVSSAAVFHIGDVFRIVSRSNAKTFAGAGSFLTGEEVHVDNHQSVTNAFDSDVFDQGNYFNV